MSAAPGPSTSPGLPLAQAVPTTAAQALPGGSVQTWHAPDGTPAFVQYWDQTERVAHFRTAAGVEYDWAVNGVYHDGAGQREDDLPRRPQLLHVAPLQRELRSALPALLLQRAVLQRLGGGQHGPAAVGLERVAGAGNAGAARVQEHGIEHGHQRGHGRRSHDHAPAPGHLRVDGGRAEPDGHARWRRHDDPDLGEPRQRRGRRLRARDQHHRQLSRDRQPADGVASSAPTATISRNSSPKGAAPASRSTRRRPRRSPRRPFCRAR